MTTWEPWRVEADDEWLAAHSSDTFAAVRRLLHPLVGTADAVSHSPLSGILGAAPRNPELKIRGVQAEQVRYAEQQYSYTTVTVAVEECRRCGSHIKQRHRMMLVDAAGQRTQYGSVAKCPRCDTGSWMFQSNMLSARTRRDHDRKVVV